MKKIILIFILMATYSICQAKPWQDYTPYTNPADADYILINDYSDKEDNDPEGTVKSLTWLYIQARDSDLTAIAALTTDTYGRALLEAATELAFQQLVNLEIGVDTQGYHVNLEAVADADTVGDADPTITMYDSTAAAGTAKIYGTSLTGDENIVMSIGVEQDTDGNNHDYITISAVTETTTIPILDYGTRFEAVTGDYNMTTGDSGLYADMCNLILLAGDHSGDATWTLPASGYCAATTIGDEYSLKKFELISNDPTDGHEIILTPAAGDTIKVRGGSEAENCSADEVLYIDNYGAVTIYGRTTSEWWVVPQGSTEVNCGSSTTP